MYEQAAVCVNADVGARKHTRGRLVLKSDRHGDIALVHLLSRQFLIRKDGIDSGLCMARTQ